MHWHSLGKVGEVLRDLCDEGECACRAVIGKLLHEVKERWGHDGGTEKTQEKRGTDQPLTDVRPTAVTALLPPGRKHFLQLTWEHTARMRRRAGVHNMIPIVLGLINRASNLKWNLKSIFLINWTKVVISVLCCLAKQQLKKISRLTSPDSEKAYVRHYSSQLVAVV